MWQGHRTNSTIVSLSLLTPISHRHCGASLPICVSCDAAVAASLRDHRSDLDAALLAANTSLLAAVAAAEARAQAGAAAAVAAAGEANRTCALVAAHSDRLREEVRRWCVHGCGICSA